MATHRQARELAKTYVAKKGAASFPRFTGKVRRNTRIPKDKWKSPFYKAVRNYVDGPLKAYALSFGIDPKQWAGWEDRFTDHVGPDQFGSRYDFRTQGSHEGFPLQTQEQVRDFINNELEKEIEYLAQEYGSGQTDLADQAIAIAKTLDNMQAVMAAAMADSLSEVGLVKYAARTVVRNLEENKDDYGSKHYGAWLKALKAASKLKLPQDVYSTYG
jgi:hypothetical protein